TYAYPPHAQTPIASDSVKAYLLPLPAALPLAINYRHASNSASKDSSAYWNLFKAKGGSGQDGWKLGGVPLLWTHLQTPSGLHTSETLTKQVGVLNFLRDVVNDDLSDARLSLWTLGPAYWKSESQDGERKTVVMPALLG